MTQSPTSTARFDTAAPDTELLAAARSGDKAALEALLDRHQAQVYRFGMKMCRHPEDAQDVLQETLLAMARGVRDFRGASSISTWLYTVARSFCIKKRRGRKFTAEQTSLDASGASDGAVISDPARAPDEVVSGKQLEVALESAIRALEPAYREVLLLRDVEGLSAAEVAEVLGVSVQAVKSRLHRARVAVRAHVAPMLGLPSDATAALGTCPDVLTLFSKHLEEEISAEVCREMESHMERCPRCRAACDSLKQTLALCRTSAPKTEVPPAVQHAVRRALQEFLQQGSRTRRRS